MVVGLRNRYITGANTNNKTRYCENNEGEIMTEDLPIKCVFTLIEQYKLHLKFLQKNDMCSEEVNIEIVCKVNIVVGISNGRR